MAKKTTQKKTPTELAHEKAALLQRKNQVRAENEEGGLWVQVADGLELKLLPPGVMSAMAARQAQYSELESTEGTKEDLDALFEKLPAEKRGKAFLRLNAYDVVGARGCCIVPSKITFSLAPGGTLFYVIPGDATFDVVEFDGTESGEAVRRSIMNALALSDFQDAVSKARDEVSKKHKKAMEEVGNA